MILLQAAMALGYYFYKIILLAALIIWPVYAFVLFKRYRKNLQSHETPTYKNYLWLILKSFLISILIAFMISVLAIIIFIATGGLEIS